jgi:hypothetical protein
MELSYDEFLEFTPAEFRLKLESYIDRRKEHFDEIKIQAWTTALLVKNAIICAFNSEAKFPELDDILKTKKTEQSPDVMECIVRMYNEALNGQIIETEG